MPPMSPKVKQARFLVEMLDGAVIEVRVTMADRLNVEMRGAKYGLADPRKQPNLVGFLWLYFAMIRQADIPAETTFEEFKTACVESTSLEEVDVPPTTESEHSASGSLSTGPESTGPTSSSAATTD